MGGISDVLGVTRHLVTTLVDAFKEEPESFCGYYMDRYGPVRWSELQEVNSRPDPRWG